jgi:hypothetical protein
MGEREEESKIEERERRRGGRKRGDRGRRGGGRERRVLNTLDVSTHKRL